MRARGQRTAEIPLFQNQLDSILVFAEIDGFEIQHNLAVSAQIGTHRRHVETVVGPGPSDADRLSGQIDVCQIGTALEQQVQLPRRHLQYVRRIAQEQLALVGPHRKQLGPRQHLLSRGRHGPCQREGLVGHRPRRVDAEGVDTRRRGVDQHLLDIIHVIRGCPNCRRRRIVGIEGPRVEGSTGAGDREIQIVDQDGSPDVQSIRMNRPRRVGPDQRDFHRPRSITHQLIRQLGACVHALRQQLPRHAGGCFRNQFRGCCPVDQSPTVRIVRPRITGIERGVNREQFLSRCGREHAKHIAIVFRHQRQCSRDVRSSHRRAILARVGTVRTGNRRKDLVTVAHNVRLHASVIRGTVT